MSDIVALHADLTRLGFSAKAAGFITDDQGLDTLDELKVLNNYEIKSLCKVVWCPGGNVPNPNAGDPGWLSPLYLLKEFGYLRYY